MNFNRFKRAAAATAAAGAATIMLTMTAVAPAHAGARDKTQAEKQVATSEKGEEPSMDQKYCMKGSMTGSRLQRMTCKTRGEWIRDDNVDPAELARQQR